MGYSPQREFLESGRWYETKNEAELERLNEIMKKNVQEMKQLADDFQKSEAEQKRLSALIEHLRKEKTSTLDMLLLLKIIIQDDLSDFDLVSDQVIAKAKEEYPNSPQSQQIWLKGAAYVYYALMTKKKESAYPCGNLTLDDAIQHCKDVLPLCENDEVRKEHEQLCKWLQELKQLRGTVKQFKNVLKT